MLLQLNSCFLDKARLIKLPLSIEGKEKTLVLKKYDLFAKDFSINLSSGEIFTPKPLNCYRGYLENSTTSFASLVIGEDCFSLVFSDSSGNYELTKTNNHNDFYLRKITNEKSNIHCTTEDTDVRPVSGSNRLSYSNCLELYIECDNKSFQDNGSSVTNTQTWLTNIFNNVITLYNNYNVPIIVSQVYIWNTPDIYTSATTVTQLRTSFVNRLVSLGISGKVGYLLSTKTIGGGISNGIGGFCNAMNAYPGPAALSTGLSTSVVNYPTYSYSVQNVAHELGHVMGLRHSHACVWNGNNSQIDDCGNVLANNNGKTPEGNACFDPLVPILPGSNGTIMSNCDQLAGQNINFSNGFGAVAGDALFLNFVNASCITGSNCGTIPPNNDECIDAIPLTLNKTCSSRTFDTYYGSQSSNTPLFSCKTQNYYTDVWFKVVVPASGALTIETTQVPGGFLDMIIQTYAGTCGAMVQVACDDNSGSGDHALVSLSGRTPGETILVRVTPLDDKDILDYGEFGICAYDASLPCHPDFNALVSFYNSTGGPSWINKTGWVNNATNCNVCTWFGVQCNNEGRVTALNLGLNNLTGSIPSSITQLSKLTRLNLYSNEFAGSLPAFLDGLPLLEYLDLGDNNFVGSLPSSYGNIANLRTLYLDNNLLTGILPVSLVNTPLSTLWLNYNNFSGCIPNGYVDFCEREASLRLDHNPLLPDSGNYTSFCSSSYGGDFDNDGYCGGSQDCLDNDFNSHPGANEICDGKDNDCDNSTDEGIPDATNTWIGTNGNWNLATNWSAGVVPQPCHNVVINPSSSYSITINNGTAARASSLNIGINAIILIQNNASLTLNAKGELVNAGDIVNYGQLTISNPLNTTGTAIQNSGNLLINSTGTLTVLNFGSTALRNTSIGSVNNNGVITINNNHTLNGLYGIDNLGNFNNAGQITVQNITGKDIRLANGSLFDNSDSGTIDLK